MQLVVQHPALSASAVSAFEARINCAPDTRNAQMAQWETCNLGADAVLALATELSIDAALLPRNLLLSDFRLIVFDMDSTLITAECIDELADFAGKKTEVSAITESAMRGELDFAGSLRKRLALLAGLNQSVLQQVYDQRVQISPGAPELICATHKAGLRTLLVSGGFTWFTERLADALNIEFNRANQLEIVDTTLTGRVTGDIVDAQAKQQEVLAVCKQIGCAPNQAIVIGDGANDLQMMRVAGLSVAYRAKPAVVAQAQQALNYSPLNAALNWFSDAR